MEAAQLTFLLLPVAAASGWYVARKYYTRKYLTDFAKPLTQAYRRGLYYLLNEKTDKAIETVVRILEQDAEPLETHIALGNLFRRTGEVEKAIEIHQRLIQQPGLTESQREKAKYELGLDYLKAGLFDRAESVFLALSQNRTFGKAALQQLLQIYQRQKDWQNAIDCTLQLRQLIRPRFGETAAHFYCELAEEAMSLHRLKDARDYLCKALWDDPDCVRASIAKGKLEMGNGEYRQALESLRQVEKQNPVYLPVVLPLIRQCWERQGNEAALASYLEYLHRDFGIVTAAVERAERMRSTHGNAAAIDYLLPIMEANPDPLAISRVLALLADDRSQSSGSLRRLCALLQEFLANKPRFQCGQCGFAVTELYWRCPSCQYWGSIIPSECRNVPAECEMTIQ